MQFIVILILIPNLPLISNLNSFNIDSNGVHYVESVANGSLNIELFVIDSSSFFFL